MENQEIKSTNNEDNDFLKNNIYLKEMINNPFEGILAIDDKGNVIFCNDFFLKAIGLKKEKLIGKKIWNVIPDCSLYDTVLNEYSQWGEILIINRYKFMIAQFPIKRNGKTIGAMIKTIFPDKITAQQIVRKAMHPIKNKEMFNKAFCTCRDIIGETDIMKYTKKLARKASRTDSNLLIIGESGTGKGVLAEAIHNRSVRRDCPFVKVNCAAIPENLLESELFGYVEGAFTGAKPGGKPGKFELAEGGTIFLDEVGDMPLYMQAKLLQVLQEKQVVRIGGTRPIKLDIRIISATNHNLNKLVKENKFRQDLYYRLKVLEIKIVPLRDRIDDLPLLVDYLLEKINRKIGSDSNGITPQSLEIMKKYSWPGNIRELENLLEQAINWSEESIIDIRNIPSQPWKIDKIKHTDNKNMDYNEIIQERERQLLIKALKESNGNKAKAARSLNMNRSVLYKKIKRLDIKE